MSSLRHWPTDEQGSLLNIGDRTKLQLAFQDLIDDAKNACLQAIEADLHSLYIIGSMARGEAQPGHSDFDFIAVLEYQVDPELVKQDWIKPTMQALSDRYQALVNGVEFDLWPQGYLFRDPAEFSPGAFLIATQSICVWGSDLVPELPRYTLRHLPTCRAVANEDLLYYSDDLEEISQALDKALLPDQVRAISRSLGKKIARAGFALALEHNREYARDVTQCAADFSRVFPDDADSMKKALRLYSHPTDQIGTLQNLLEGFAAEIEERAAEWLDSNNPDWEEFFPVGEEDEDTDDTDE